MKKRIAIIGTVGLPANYGGFETLTEHLVNDLGDTYDLTVYCSGKKYKKHERRDSYQGAKLKYIPLKANGIQSIPYDSLSILSAVFKNDVLLILGVAGAWLIPFVRLFTNKKIIISIDGIEWKRDKWSPLAKLYLWWAESLAVKYSHIDISDNESIQDYTAQRYGSLSAVIEYGGDHTIAVKPTENDKIEYPILSEAYAFKVCRIEPENNIEMILKAFSFVESMPLVLVGNWNNSEYGKRLKTEYGHYKNIHLYDPIYNQRTLDLLRGNAFVYLHGHSAGGTNPSLVEAMSLGLPIIAFGAVYNKTTTENKALYFYSTNELIEILQSAYFQKMQQIGNEMKEIADRRYKWNIVSNRYSFLFKKVLEVKKKKNVKQELPKWSADTFQGSGLAHLKSQSSFYELIQSNKL